MAEYHQEEGVETGDRGLLDFTKKKDEDKVISSEFDEKVMVSDHPYNLHRSSISSSEEERKSIKEKLQQDKLERDTEVPIEKIDVEEEEEKLPGHQADDDVAYPPPKPAPVAGEECNAPPPEQEEKKGILEKIKDKIPGLHSKEEEEEEKAKE